MLGLLSARRRRIDVTGPTQRRSNSIVSAHQSATIPPDDLLTVDGIATTSVHRVLLDLARADRQRTVEIAINASIRDRTFDLRKLEDVIDRNTGHRRIPRLLAALDAVRGGSSLTDSELEEAFLAIARAAGRPLPRTQFGIGTQRLDFYWPQFGFAVEVDSWTYHRDPEAFRRDHEKVLECRERGIELLPISDHLIDSDPGRVAQLLLTSRDRRTPAPG